MDPTLQAALAALIGAVVAGGAVLAWHISDRQQRTIPPYAQPVVPDGVGTVLSVLRSSAVVVDDNDEVLKASAPAYALGLVRGSKLVSADLADVVRKVRRDGQIRETELLMARPGVPSRYVTARVAPLGSRLVLALVEDRTREKRVEEVRRDFVANVSHELKTPVGAIRLLSDAMQDAADDPEAVRRFADRMFTESERLGKLVQQIIELSRLQADDPLDAPVAVHLDDVIATAVDTSRMDAENKNIQVMVGGTSDLQVFGNEQQVLAAVSNLVSNAVVLLREGLDGPGHHACGRGLGRHLGGRPGHRHPRRGARPHLRTFLPGRPRPPPLHRRHRARPVHRQARRRHPWRRGPGLVGRGSGLYVHPHAAPALRSREKDTGGQPVTRVLVVEDEESYSDALAYMLRKEGFEVAIAADGNTALTEFDRNGADIVLLDLMLPGIPGTEVCRQIRATSSVPVIMVSAKDDEVDKVVGLELGADDYVTKPYSRASWSPASARCCAAAPSRSSRPPRWRPVRSGWTSSGTW